AIVSVLRLRRSALRQQLVVFKRKRSRPPLQRLDRLFWIGLRRWWSGWVDTLIIVNSDTVASWHRSGYTQDVARHGTGCLLGHAAGDLPAERLLRRLGMRHSDDTVLRNVKRQAAGRSGPAVRVRGYRRLE